MSHDELISDERVNAFIDDQLDQDERAQMMAALQENQQLCDKVNQLRHVKEMLTLAYDDPPKPLIYPASRKVASQVRPAMAASVLLLLGFGLGWWLHLELGAAPEQSFITVKQLNSDIIAREKVLMHVSTMDGQRIETALQKAEYLLAGHRKKESPLDLEIIVNAKGLGLLRNNSPYADKVKNLVAEYDNVSFLACGVARETARLKEGRAIELLPEAIQVPAALERILKRIRKGWVYVKV